MLQHHWADKTSASKAFGMAVNVSGREFVPRCQSNWSKWFNGCEWTDL